MRSRSLLAALALVPFPYQLQAAGEPDPTFGDAGIAVIRAEQPSPYGEFFSDALTSASGRYVGVGVVYSEEGAHRQGLIAGRLPNGAPDPYINGVGHVYVQWKGYGISIDHVRERFTDGKLVIAGALAASSPDSGTLRQPVVCRLSTDGQLDAGFADDGCARLGTIAGRSVFWQYGLADLELRSDDGILVLGTAATNDAGDPRSFAIAALDAGGEPDLYFGDSDCSGAAPRCGSVFSPENIDDAMFPRAMGIDQNNGQILVAGEVQVFSRAAVMRYSAGGTFEMTFDLIDFEQLIGSQGRDLPEDILVLADSSVILLGTAEGSSMAGYPRKVSVAKMLPGGSYDHSFGTQGRAIYGLGPESRHYATALALQNDGKFLVGGFSNVADGPMRCRLLRVSSKGAVDSSFGDNGVADLLLSNTNNCYVSKVIPEAKNVVIAGSAGFSEEESDNDPFFYRLGRDGIFSDGLENES